jgi:guanosine-3',5'-bis(diphosphate) 3'-pyrophosphohydrolase
VIPDNIQEEKRQFLQYVASYNSNASLDLISKAYDFCFIYHAGQLRRSKEPYYTHPIEVSREVVKLHMDDTTIAVALLHDILEDTSITKDILIKEFSLEVAELVDGVTKLEKIKFKQEQIRQVENFRKLFLALSKDVRVLIVKLCDRLHNMRTLLYHDNEEKQKRIALETLEIYAPLAERVGLQNIKNELQDISFMVLNPEIYSQIKESINKVKKDFESSNIVEDVIDEIKSVMQKNDIICDVLGREKYPFSIWRKMQNRSISFEDLSDIFAFRIIVSNVSDCYRALGAIHLSYYAVPSCFTDYISTPKINNYQSIHTKIMGPKKNIIDIQIRTQKMNLEAEYGLAAHWRYKQSTDVDSKQIMQLKSAWVNRVLKILEGSLNSENVHEVMRAAKIEIKEDTIFVFTDKGDILDLPKGSTVLDFAFAIDVNKGIYFDYAAVNGEKVGINYVIQNGDKVKIFTSNFKTITANYLNCVITGKARDAILKIVSNEMANIKAIRD